MPHFFNYCLHVADSMGSSLAIQRLGSGHSARVFQMQNFCLGGRLPKEISHDQEEAGNFIAVVFTISGRLAGLRSKDATPGKDQQPSRWELGS